MINSRINLTTGKLSGVMGLDLLCSGVGQCKEICDEKDVTITSDKNCANNLKCCAPNRWT